MEKSIIVEWNSGSPKGQIEIRSGRLKESKIICGNGVCKESVFSFIDDQPCRISITIDEVDLSNSKNSTIVTFNLVENSFSFFLRDVEKKYPIFIPEYNVVVTEVEDERSYLQISDFISSKDLKTNIQRINSEPEESFENAAANTRELRCPTWLGLSRDIRIFELGFRADDGKSADWIQPRFHGHEVNLTESNDLSVKYYYMMGRGVGCTNNVSRYLDEGFLPILKGKIEDDSVHYKFTTFASLEKSELTSDTLRGTHYLVADSYGHNYMHTEEQKKTMEMFHDSEMNQGEETVIHFKAEAKNYSDVPKYAWFKTVWPQCSFKRLECKYHEDTGFGSLSSEGVFCISRVNGKPMEQEETAILLKPGEAATFEFVLPHRPISYERAKKLTNYSFEKRLAECRSFWRCKLQSSACIRLPEKRIENAIQAGLLHLDLVAYGNEPDGTVAPTIGVYCPIGSESAPIIQFMDSMGWHELARRSIMYFLDKQHDDGFIQNFDGYMLETGAVLWSMGEHYRYTRDEEWVTKIKEKLLKACDHIFEWRNRNKREELRNKGYGMMEGKVADPEDHYRSFMLNGYSYLGLSRAAETLSVSDPLQSVRIRKEAEELKLDIKEAVYGSMGNAPVVPLENGTWSPTVPPWVETCGPVSLYANGGSCFTHGSFLARDSLIGPLWLIIQEVITPYEFAAEFMLKYHCDLMHIRNVAFSQPYYSIHPWIHLKRGEVKAFLKAYYNTFSSLADRETYTFWEHLYKLSPHKTHEEAWFLMHTRWMLYMEEGKTLKLLCGIPRAWMEDNKCIEISNAPSYFGPISVKVESEVDSGCIKAKIECISDRRPQIVEIRLPHPDGNKGIGTKGGIYDSHNEIVRIENFNGYAEIELRF